MEDNGYYFIRCFIGEDSLELERSDSKTVRMAEIFFAQKQPANILKWARQYKYFYHVTPSRNMSFIRKYGLVPQKRESEFNITNEEIHYPERTYFFCSDDDETAIEYAMMDMMSGNYHLLKIDIKNFPESIPVYSDPLLGGNAVYIEQTIEPDLIEDLGNFEINERTRSKYLKR